MTNSRQRLFDKKAPQVTVRATTHHCKTASRRDSLHCMIIDAVFDSYRRGVASSILVDAQFIRFTDLNLGERYVYPTPPIAQKALIDFDEGKMVKPFSFKLMPASGMVFRSGWHGQKRPSTATRRGKKYRKTGVHNRYAVTRFRQFGLRLLRKTGGRPISRRQAHA